MSEEHALPASLSSERAPHQRRWLLWTGLVALLVVGALLAARLHRSSTVGAASVASASASARLIPVVVAPVAERDVPIYLEGLGNAVPLSTVMLKPQVDGRLVRVLFTEGQRVKKGDLLAEIDPRPFAIQLHQAEATLARDSAQLENARVALARDQALRKDGLIPQQQLDDQQAAVNQLQASLQGDRAQIEAARLQLDYASVRSPINGVTGVRLVDAGNLVRASDTGGLVVITELDPMAITFNLPQDDLARVNQALAKAPLEVEITNRDGTQRLGKGTLTLVDNQVNSATATVRLKATVPNPDRLLWPNQFVKARLLVETRRGALVVPATAIQRGPDGALVYVVNQASMTEARKVEVDSVHENIAIIRKGVQRDERVVTEGQSQLRPNAKVSVRGAGANPG
jgi:multidrug efflux system membrane fusion protein